MSDDGQDELDKLYMITCVELLTLNARTYRYLLLPEAWCGLSLGFLFIAASEVSKMLLGAG